MQIQLETYHLFMIVATLVAAFYTLARIILKQTLDNLDVRLSSLSEIKSEVHSAVILTHQLETDLLRLRAELPVQYMRQDDWRRFEDGLNKRLDALSLKLDNIGK